MAKWLRLFRSKAPSPFMTSTSHSSNDKTCDFDPNEISWITDSLGVTNVKGALQAMKDGCYIVNTAEEFHTPERFFKEVIDPRNGHEAVKESLRILTEVIHDQIYIHNRKVVVHCQMGMERSVLTVIWYLHTRLHLSFDEAYEKVRSKRPIAVSHREWVNM